MTFKRKDLERKFDILLQDERAVAHLSEIVSPNEDIARYIDSSSTEDLEKTFKSVIDKIYIDYYKEQSNLNGVLSVLMMKALAGNNSIEIRSP